MNRNLSIIYTSTCLLLCSCSTSHVLVGKARAPVNPDDVRVFLRPPKHYEEIAILNSDSNGSFKFSGQGKVDAALNRMKNEAAKLGANGILIGGAGDSGSVSIGSAFGQARSTGSFSGTGVGVSGGGLVKTMSGLAIYVTEE